MIRSFIHGTLCRSFSIVHLLCYTLKFEHLKFLSFCLGCNNDFVFDRNWGYYVIFLDLFSQYMFCSVELGDFTHSLRSHRTFSMSSLFTHHELDARFLWAHYSLIVCSFHTFYTSLLHIRSILGACSIRFLHTSFGSIHIH